MSCSDIVGERERTIGDRRKRMMREKEGYREREGEMERKDTRKANKR